MTGLVTLEQYTEAEPPTVVIQATGLWGAVLAHGLGSEFAKSKSTKTTIAKTLDP